MPEAMVMLILMRIIIFLRVAFQDVSAVKFSAGNQFKSEEWLKSEPRLASDKNVRPAAARAAAAGFHAEMRG